MKLADIGWDGTSVMNCTNHPEVLAKMACPVCLKPFCKQCLVRVGDREICPACFAQNPGHAVPPLPPRAKPAETLSSPGAAFGLGLIPGVGAIYNGEYLKAFVHVLIFGFLISLSSSSNVGSFEPLFGLLTTAFYCYMPLEAYHTARRSVLEANGFQVDSPSRDPRQETFWTGVILTVMGCLLFINELVPGSFEQVLRFWPVVLIGFGVYKLREHLGRSTSLKAVEE